MEPFLGQIMMFGGNFAPRGWALCDGQLLPISQYSALFSILGTTYGGDGRTTFGLPDLRGRAPIHAGQGPGLTSYRIGQRGGVEDVTLNVTQIPSHNHFASLNDVTLGVSSAEATLHKPEAGSSLAAGNLPGSRGAGNPTQMYSTATPNIPLASQSVSGNVTVNNTGGNLSHENRQPFLATYYIIALQGVFPSRS